MSQIPAQPIEDEGRTAAAVVYALYLLSVPSAGLLALVGVVIAYAVRGSASPWVRTHFDRQVREFWATIAWAVAIGLLFGVGVILAIVLIGVPMILLAKLLLVVLTVWFFVASLLGLLRLLQGRPVSG